VVKLCLVAVALFFVLPACAVHAAEAGESEKTNPFFAMDTAARGEPGSVVPLLKELGYDGLGGSPRNSEVMADALEKEGLRLFNVYLPVDWNAARPALTTEIRQTIGALQGHDSALWIAVGRIERDGKTLRVVLRSPTRLRARSSVNWPTTPPSAAPESHSIHTLAPGSSRSMTPCA
jgi:hypothetical protein